MSDHTSLADLVRQRRLLDAPAQDDWRRLRVEAGLTLDELGQELGVSAGTLSRWESGDRQPRPKMLRRYMAALQVIRQELSTDEPKVALGSSPRWTRS